MNGAPDLVVGLLLLGEGGEFLDGTGPAVPMTITGLFGGEAFVADVDLGAAAGVLEADGDEGDFAGIPGGIPGELEQFVGDDLGVGSGGRRHAVGRVGFGQRLYIDAVAAA